jgi:hypothetical protein
MLAREQGVEQRETHVIAHKLANVGGPGVRGGVDLDQHGILDGAGLLGREGGVEVDAPVGAQPNQRLDGDDGADPDKGPFGRLDVLVVELSGEVEAQEDGPYYGEGPDVEVLEQGQRPEQVGALDLRVVDERRHGCRWDQEMGSPFTVPSLKQRPSRECESAWR